MEKKFFIPIVYFFVKSLCINAIDLPIILLKNRVRQEKFFFNAGPTLKWLGYATQMIVTHHFKAHILEQAPLCQTYGFTLKGGSYSGEFILSLHNNSPSYEIDAQWFKNDVLITHEYSKYATCDHHAIILTLRSENSKKKELISSINLKN